jgi:predicted RNase H-like HicB family nuclease
LSAFERKEPFVYRFPVKVAQRGEGFVVTIPAVPGCVTSGRSREEALRKAREVLRAFLAQAGPGFSPASGTSPPTGEGTGGEYVEVAPPAVPPC